MSVSRLRKSFTGALTILVLVMFADAVSAIGDGVPNRRPLADDRSKVVGTWTGESICVGNNPSCHDEKVRYRISKSGDAPGKVIIAADKIVNGKWELMGVLDFKYDAGKGTLIGEFTNSRYHGLWEYTVKGDSMEGTLTLLPAKTIARRVKVKKDAPE